MEELNDLRGKFKSMKGTVAGLEVKRNFQLEVRALHQYSRIVKFEFFNSERERETRLWHLVIAHNNLTKHIMIFFSDTMNLTNREIDHGLSMLLELSRKHFKSFLFAARKNYDSLMRNILNIC